jgi:hypothetical protein
MPSVINSTFSEGDEEVQIGTGTIRQPEYPSYFYYDFGYFGQIYTATEIGVSRPITITALRFNMGESDGAETMINQTLKLGQVNQDQFDINIRNDFTQVPLQPTPWLSSNIQTVKSNFTWTVPNNGAPWIEIQFDTPYLYDPTGTNSNLLVIWENRDGSYTAGSGSPWAFSNTATSGGTFRSYNDYQDNTMPSLISYGARDSSGRPNIQIVYSI